MPQVKTWKGRWGRDDVRANRKAMFVFGDNDLRKGTLGQACIRHERNAIGFSTKRLPSLLPGSFLTDDELVDNERKFDAEVERILRTAHKYDVLYFPEDGLGTGLAQLPTRSPKTFALLQLKIESLKRNLEPAAV